MYHNRKNQLYFYSPWKHVSIPAYVQPSQQPCTVYNISNKKKVQEQLHFRPMRVEDLSVIMMIENRSYTAPWGEYLYRSELMNPSGFYSVAMLNGQIVGYAGMRYNAAEAHLMTMVVDPNYRGLGIGDAILSHKLSMMKEKGAKSVILEVRVSNIGAQNLYSKYGFKQTGVRKRYYPDNLEDALVMTLLF